MQAEDIDHMFKNFRFTRTAAEIKEKAKKKVEQVSAKIEERHTRITALRKEYDIDDSDIIQLLTAARKATRHGQSPLSYTYSKMSNVPVNNEKRMEEKNIGAGVVQNLLTESDFIEAEKDQVKRLNLIIRNLKPIPQFASGNGVALPEQEFGLTEEELEYLGF